MIRTRRNRKIITRGQDGQPNGFLVPIFNASEDFVAPAQHPQQVYLTVIARGRYKGPHLHMKRWGLFTCVKGNAKIVLCTPDGYREYFTGEEHGFQTVQVPPGLAAALVCLGDEDAYVINMPAPPWRPDDQDDHPVTGWTYPLP
jgi:dTDP-4-dehydrorhamnose 3,5-epimerase-like enzyme